MAYSNLQTNLEILTAQAAEQHPGAELSVAVLERNGGLVAGVEPDREYEALSLAKLGIVLASGRLAVDPETVIMVEGRDIREGGPLAHFLGEEITIGEAMAEALVVSGNTGPQVVTRACGGPAQVNAALGSEFAISGLRTVSGGKDFASDKQPYTHGLTTAREVARLLALLLNEYGQARNLLAHSNDTYGLRRDTDRRQGDSFRPAGTVHPADMWTEQIDMLIREKYTRQLSRTLNRLLAPKWKAGEHPSKSGIDDDPNTGISARHDVADINGLAVATLTAYPYNEQNPGFDLGKGHPAHDFQAAVGRLVANR